MKETFFIICIFLISPLDAESQVLSDEYFYLESFDDLKPNESGEVLLNGKRIHPLKVKHLHFADSGLNNFEVKTLPEELSNFKNLESLWIGMRGFEQLPEVVLSLKNLKSLDLQHGAIRELPEEIVNLRKLEEIILLGSGIQDLPMELAQLDSLKNLHLGLTPLCTIPEVLGCMDQLQELVIIDHMVSESCKRVISRENLCATIKNDQLKINGKKCP